MLKCNPVTFKPDRGMKCWSFIGKISQNNKVVWEILWRNAETQNIANGFEKIKSTEYPKMTHQKNFTGNPTFIRKKNQK